MIHKELLHYKELHRIIHRFFEIKYDKTRAIDKIQVMKLTC